MRYDDTDNVAPLAAKQSGSKVYRVITDTALLRGAVQRGLTVLWMIERNAFKAHQEKLTLLTFEF